MGPSRPSRYRPLVPRVVHLTLAQLLYARTPKSNEIHAPIMEAPMQTFVTSLSCFLCRPVFAQGQSPTIGANPAAARNQFEDMQRAFPDRPRLHLPRE